MGLRCKVGDLAIVLRSPTDRAGRICMVDSFVGFANTVNDGLQGDMWAVSYNGETHSGRGFRYGCRDSDLLPIRPEELKEEEERERELDKERELVE